MKTQKETILKSVCISYYVIGGVALSIHLIALFSLLLLESITTLPILNKLYSLITVGGTWFIFISFALQIISLWGVYQIKHHEKIGLHIFLIAQLSSLLAPYVFIVSPVNIPLLITLAQLPNFIITGVFLVLFFSVRKLLK